MVVFAGSRTGVDLRRCIDMRRLLHSIVPWPQCRRCRFVCLSGSPWQSVYDMHAVHLCQALLYPRQYRKLQLQLV